MPRERGKVDGRLKPFGEWVNTLRKMFGLSLQEVSERAGIAANTLSTSIQVGNTGPSLETVRLVWQAFSDLAHQEKIASQFVPEVKEAFFNAAGFASEEQLHESMLRRVMLEEYVCMQEQYQSMHEQVRQLQAELHESRIKVRFHSDHHANDPRSGNALNGILKNSDCFIE